MEITPDGGYPGTMTGLDVVLPDGSVFTGRESAVMAALVYKRWSKDASGARAAYQRLMQNNIGFESFYALVKAGLQILDGRNL